MTSLSRGDTEALLALAYDVGAARTADELRDVSVPALRALIGADIASHTVMWPVGGAASWSFDPGGEPFPGAIEAFSSIYRDHPVLSHFVRTGDASAHTTSEFVSLREFQRTESYQRCFRPIGARFQLATTVTDTGRRTAGVGFGFTRCHRDFGDREREMLNLARPVLGRGYRDVAAREAADERLRALEAGLAEEGRVLVVLAGGRVNAGGPAGLDLLRRWFPDGSLPTARCGDPLVLERDGARLTVRGVPGRPWLLLDETRYAPDEARLRELGLTPREANVLRLVAEGMGDAAIAAELFVSVRTVHKHLEHAYRKLGVNDRRAAVARLLGPDLPQPRSPSD